MRYLTLISLFIAAFANESTAEQSVLVSLPKEKQIAIYGIDAETGTLRKTDSVDTAASPGAMCLGPDERSLYVAIKGTGSIAAFRIGDDAKLSLLGDSKVGHDASYLKVDPTGKFLLSSYYSVGRAAVHRIAKDGCLANSTAQVVETDEKAHSITVDPAGKFVFVSHTRPNSIFQFKLDSETGVLSAREPAKLIREENSGPRHLWFHPGGQFAFGSDEQGSSVTGYQLDSANGTLKTLQTVSSLPANATEQRNSTSDIEVHPSGKFVFVANRGHNTIAGFRIQPETGELSLIGHTPTEPANRSFNITSDGQFLIAAGQKSGMLRVFRINEDGVLSQTSRIRAGRNAWWVQTVHHD